MSAATEEAAVVRVFLSADYLEIPAQLRDRRDIVWIHPEPQGVIPDVHLYIWDYTPGLDLSYILARRNAQHLLIADPKYLVQLGETQNFACILLKPVAPLTLKAFVELAFKTWEMHRQAREAESLRLDRDTLLQYVLDVNLKLQQYDQERSNFLARALHDFRAPLTALYGYCGLLAQGKLGLVSPSQYELLERMRRNTERLARMAGSTLDLLLQGRFEKPAKLRESDIVPILDRALDDVYSFLQEKHLRVEKQIDPPRGILHLEPEQIQEVVVNLLENSCKFTPQNGNIQISGYTVCAQDNWEFTNREQGEGAIAYRIDISDSGPGVPTNLAERVFEEYASYSGSADRSGGGLGLAICRAIIKAHGGRIWTTPGGRGGRFSFVLPMTPSRTVREQLSVSEDSGEIEAAAYP